MKKKNWAFRNVQISRGSSILWSTGTFPDSGAGAGAGAGAGVGVGTAIKKLLKIFLFIFLLLKHS